MSLARPLSAADGPISRGWTDTAAGIGTAVLIVIAIVFPRSATAMFMIPVVVAFAIYLFDPVLRAGGFAIDGLLVAIVAFCGWSLLSTLWSAAPGASISKPIYALAGSVGVAMLAALGRKAAPELVKALGWGMVFGFVFGAVLVCIETVSNQAIVRFFMNSFAFLREGYSKHLAYENGVVAFVSEANINRRATVVTLLMIPSALLVTAIAGPALKWAALAAMAAISAIFLVASTHQSSQAAIVAGAIAFGMTKLAPVWSRRLIGLAWCVSCLLIVPIVTTMHDANLHRNEAVFNSARHRVVIWNTTAQRIKTAPIIGIGADASATIAEATAKKEAELGNAVKDGAYVVTTARHAHNAFVQVWYELGGIGALLFMGIGLAVLALTARASAYVQPFLVAQFAAVAAMVAFSFSIWQLWIQGAIGLGVLVLLAAVLVKAPASERAEN